MRFGQSNEPWIGEIPAGWVLTAIKRLVSTKITDGPHETPELEDDGVQFISAEAIKNNQIDFDLRRGFISWELHEQYSRKCKPQKNDIFVIKSGATTGNVAYVDVDFEFSIWSPLALIRCDEQVAFYKFVYYVLLTDVFRKQVELSWSFGTQQNIGMGVIERLKVPIPSIDEQRQIAAFLDASCAAIDAAVAAKRRQLETLGALRTALIYEAVTQGVNRNIATVVHDIPSYGRTPKHWKRSKLRYEISIQNGDFASDKLQDDGTYQIFGGNGVMGYIDLSNVDGETVVVGRVGAYCGNAHYVQGRAWVSDNALIVKSRHHGRFLYHLFNALNFNGQANNTAQPVITGTKIKNTYVVLPPRAEQEAICTFLDTKLAEVKRIVTGIDSQIATLTAYRKSLIHECVTGQRRITEADVARASSGESESMRANR
jgi:type I restriction enzyme S subunit